MQPPDEPLERFELLYATAHGDPSTLSWVDLEPSPLLVGWLAGCPVFPPGARVLVAGCGLGFDAEELSQGGFQVTAVDISPTAIDWCRQRWPESKVEYRVADLTSLPAELSGCFDAVVEINTLQVLKPEHQQQLLRSLAAAMVDDGVLFVLCRGRELEEVTGHWPCPLAERELQALTTECGLVQESFEDLLDGETPPVRRFRAVYRRAT